MCEEIDAFFFELGIDLEKCFLDARKGGEETERPSSYNTNDIPDESIDFLAADGIADIADIGRGENERLRAVIKIGCENVLRECLQGKGFFDISEIPVDRERRARGNACIERRIEFRLQYFPDVERSHRNGDVSRICRNNFDMRMNL